MKKQHLSIILAAIITAVCLVGRLQAEVSAAHIFGDHMVLQQQKPVVVWGWAEEGENVTVQLGNNIKTVRTCSEGKWKVELPAMEASSEPMKMTIKAANVITIEDILVGEVWLCSGQSNMVWDLNGANVAETGAQEILKADFPKIRLFKINSQPSPYKVADVNDNWQVCTPNNAADFSAVGYFFGKRLYQELNIPIGLVQAAWGGTRIEPWTPLEGFQSQEALADVVKQIDQAEPSYRKQLPAKIKEMEAWIKIVDKALKNNERISPPPNWPKYPIYSGGHPTEPTCLYNSHIFPIVPFALRGAIWYQGESNMSEGMIYYEKMKALIYGWRKVWDDPSLSFYYVQLAPFIQWAKDDLPKIWQAQTESLNIPNTGMAVISDIGDIEDIHPRNKRDVGKRLALWALAKNYGRKNLVFSGPIYKSIEITDGKIRISFDYVGDGLTCRNDKDPDWFEIAGADRVFHPANAKIVGDTVELHSDKVTSPVAARFAWDNIAVPNLANKNGLPASSFRTDNW